MIDFEWDKRKAAANLRKHAVTFDEAATIFKDTFAATIVDPDYFESEDRFITVGISRMLRLLVVVHTDQGNMCRIISARLSTAQERKRYEEG
ncbi:MAG: BrnT family toxin [Desulfuromonadales bacterium]